MSKHPKMSGAEQTGELAVAFRDLALEKNCDSDVLLSASLTIAVTVAIRAGVDLERFLFAVRNSWKIYQEMHYTPDEPLS